jgi:hypothetical protein
MRLTFFQPNPGVLSMLLNSSSLVVQSSFNTSKLDDPAIGARFQRARYSRVRFRKELDGTVIAFENCGCEADANTLRSCRMHHGDEHQAARLKAEARYHCIQKCGLQDRSSEIAGRREFAY